jgi:2-octaprenyl-6-methoxyphenol hydroxylase
VDDSHSLIRAPEALFDSAELGLTAFGHNIENTHLLAALGEAAERTPNLRIVSSPVSSVEPDAEAVRIAFASGENLRAKIVVGADGSKSITRQAAGIAAKTRDYPQAALTLNYSHSRPHNSVSTEFHRRGGPLVVVPLPDDRSSIVLVNTPEEIERLANLDDAAFGVELERMTHGLLGRITPGKARGVRKLGKLTVDQFGKNRIALVGEAGHVLPPIGAQGLNLGIRDAAEIAALAADALAGGKDPGGAAVLDAYDSARRADAAPRQIAIDLLNRSLIADFLPFDAGRALGIWALTALPPLRREVMRRGLALAG